MGFIQPAPGGRESTTASVDTQVRIPRLIMWKSTLDDCLSIAGTALFAYLILGLFWALVSRERETCRGYWSCIWQGVIAVWYVARVTFWIPLAFMLHQFDHHRNTLHHYRFEPEQHDPHYPPPYKAREPMDAGMSYWDHVRRQQEEVEVEDEPPFSFVPPVIVQQADGTRSAPSLPPLPAEQGEYKLKVFLLNVMARPPIRAFSRDGAMERGLYTRSEWEALARWCAHPDRRFYKDRRGLTSLGRRWAYETIMRLSADNGTEQPPTPQEQWEGAGEGDASVLSHPVPSRDAAGEGDDTTEEAGK